MPRVFADAGVLIAAARSVSRDRDRALEALSDPAHEFVTSVFVELEVIPKASFHKKTLELEFYRTFFDGAVWIDDVREMVGIASKEAVDHGMAAIDALHVAAALMGSAVSLFTTEKPGKPIYRTKHLNVVYLFE